MMLIVKGKFVRFLSLVAFWAVCGVSTLNAQHNAVILPSRMQLVRDPWGKNQPVPEAVSLVHSGYWRSGERGNDSLGIAMLNFRVNSALLERDYMDNARVLELIHRTFADKRLLSSMDFITITAAASPEGNVSVNEKLASDRALAVRTYIMWKYPFMDRDRIFTFSIGEDWAGLRKMIENDHATPFRQDVLLIIDSYPSAPTRWRMIKELGGGTAYSYLSKYMMPYLRGAVACMIYYKEDSKPITVTETLTQVDTVYIDRLVEKTIEIPVIEQSASQSKPYQFAVKTNLLYDIALLPNLALEFPLGNRWSVEVEGQWSWWNTKTTHNNCWRIQTAGLELRKWLGSKSLASLNGHYLGLYGMAGTYDVKFRNKNGYLSDMSYSAGLSYGYAFPIARRFNLEFGLAAGYFGGKYKVYDQYDVVNEMFPLKERRNMHYFGLTKAKVSLVWIIGGGKR